jgi:hypothetical protein
LPGDIFNEKLFVRFFIFDKCSGVRNLGYLTDSLATLGFVQFIGLSRVIKGRGGEFILDPLLCDGLGRLVVRESLPRPVDGVGGEGGVLSEHF